MNALPYVGAALSAVLSSGVTAAYLRATEPDVLSRPGPWQLAPETRHLAALLAAPAAPYVPVDDGAPVDVEAMGAQGLTVLGFVRGWARTWRTGADEKVESFLLEFADAAGALSYARGLGSAAPLLLDPEPFTVTGVPGASGLADRAKDRNGFYARVVVIHRGPRAALLVFSQRSVTPGPDVVSLAQRQYAALPDA